ncbi:hypothetical protein [Burkholderia sola]|uniref:hypothetical protein n=1 Tax=Burkholderia sola TaxID=2843302 RepID=UPI00338D364C
MRNAQPRAPARARRIDHERPIGIVAVEVIDSIENPDEKSTTRDRGMYESKMVVGLTGNVPKAGRLGRNRERNGVRRISANATRHFTVDANFAAPSVTTDRRYRRVHTEYRIDQKKLPQPRRKPAKSE